MLVNAEEETGGGHIMRIKPILFNTDMVRAILEDRKTVTRRAVKPQPNHAIMTAAGLMTSNSQIRKRNGIVITEFGDVLTWEKLPYRPGDILYVRETWKQAVCDPAGGGAGLRDLYLYKADEPIDTSGMDTEKKWHPSIHMPREAARIFLRVKDVRVERLQDITDEQAKREGYKKHVVFGLIWVARDWFIEAWDDTIKPADRVLYGWNANPWVWVIEFERISKEETQHGEK